MLLAVHLHNAHPASPEAGQLWLVAEGRDLDAVGSADFEDRLAFTTLNDASVYLEPEGGRGDWSLGCLSRDQVFRM